MPTFSTQPPPDPRGQALPIRRTPDGRPLVAVVTSPEIIGTNTHFYGGRTVPCEAPNCNACQDGLSWRWHGYLTAIDAKNGQHFLFEVTAQAAQAFVEYRKLYGTLRGCLFEASRTGARKNGRVFIRCKPNTNTALHLPESANLPTLLCNLWNVPAPAATEAGQQWNAPAMAIDPAIVAATQAVDRQTRGPRPPDPTRPRPGDPATDPILAAAYSHHFTPTSANGTAKPTHAI